MVDKAPTTTNDNEKDYVLSEELERALDVARITGRPLLIKGEPGTGKSLLAEFVAQKMGCQLFKWTIKSTSEAKDGLYYYDAVSRLNDARFADLQQGRNVHRIEDYIRFGALGQAFLNDQPCVVLIDEIDKADIEFPNDLLQELDQMEFVITETNQLIKAKQRPLTIITSNNEKELPDAFLRRCIFHYINFPDPEFMTKIIEAHFPQINQNLMKAAVDCFYKIRDLRDLKKRPSTSELIDWLQMLISQNILVPSKGEIPYLGALIKNEEDFKLFSKK